MSHGFWRAAGTGAALSLTVALGACSDEAGDTGAVATSAAAEAGTIPGMTISNARMVLAPVAGNPAAIYFDLAYEGEKGLTIRKAEIAQAQSAMLHQYGEYDFKVQMMEALPIPLTKGTRVEFKPGDLHVMAMQPDASLKPGDLVDVTLTVSGGMTHTFKAEVRAAGEAR
ncbi:MAG: copper chaperone PCu(A)C [Erythrobacter sp.]|nr:copper chaperone PCu(A)C [Erythrobacter sp.]